MTTVTMGRSTSARVARHHRRTLKFNDHRLALILDDQLERNSPNEDPPAPQTPVSADAKQEIAPLLEIAVLLRFLGQTVRQSIATEQARTRGNANKPSSATRPMVQAPDANCTANF